MAAIADCGNLDNPINGEVMISPNTFENSIANYSCFEGYDLVGDATRTCLSTKTWSLSAPLCQSKEKNSEKNSKFCRAQLIMNRESNLFIGLYLVLPSLIHMDTLHESEA